MNLAIIERFLASPQGREIGAAQEQQQHSERQKLADRLAVLKEERPRLVEKHATERAPLEKVRAKTKARLQEETARLETVDRAHANVLHGVDFEISRLELELAAPTRARLREVRSSMYARFDAARNTIGRSDSVSTDKINSYTMRPVERQRSNQAAIRRLHVAMRTASHALEQVPYENPTDLEGAIAAILAPVEQCWKQINDLEFDDGPQAA